MREQLSLTELSEEERQQALTRYQLLRPFLDGKTSLTDIAKNQKPTLRTLQRWARSYRRWGLVGLARRRRSDAGKRRMPDELKLLIESLALQKNQPSAAAIHRQIVPIAEENGWSIPSYDSVYDTVRAIDKAMISLAHDGSHAYRQQFDLLYRREAKTANEIWQADHIVWTFGLLMTTEKQRGPGSQ